MVSLTAYVSLSTVALLSVVFYACYSRGQFYGIVLFLVNSKISIVAAGNMVIALTFLFGYIFKSIFFGKLRDVEVELLLDRFKYSIMETLLALTIFRNEMSPKMLVMFGVLLFIKSFHWLAKSRIDYLEQVLPTTYLTHIRIFSLLSVLAFVDSLVSYLCILQTMKAGRTVLILLGFEFGVLTISTLTLTSRYCLHLIDSNLENGLQSKGLYIMVVNLISDGLKFAVYLIFFVLVFVYYGLPIHILRDLWIAFTNFKQQLVSFINYLRLSSNLDARFENATPAEILDSGDCLICREGMTRAKKLPCGHLFHLDCLRMWLQHQQSCPLCRANIPTTTTAAATAIQQANIEPVPNHENNANNGNPPDINLNAEQQQPQPMPNINNVEASFPASSSTTTPATVATTSSASPRSLPLHPIGNDLPGFFLVCAPSGILLRTGPSVTETQLRCIKAGTLVFATSRHIAGDGSQWLKLPDGWAMESVLSEQSCDLLLVPYKVVEASQQSQQLQPHSHAHPVSLVNESSGTRSVGNSQVEREIVGLSDSELQLMPKPAGFSKESSSSNNNISNTHIPSTNINHHQYHSSSQSSSLPLSLPSITISSTRLPNTLTSITTNNTMNSTSTSFHQISDVQSISSNHLNIDHDAFNDDEENEDRETVEVLGGVQSRIESMAIYLSNIQDELAVMQAMVSGILADKHHQSFRRRLRRDLQSATSATTTTSTTTTAVPTSTTADTVKSMEESKVEPVVADTTNTSSSSHTTLVKSKEN